MHNFQIRKREKRLTWPESEGGDVGVLHVERNQLVGVSYLDIEDMLRQFLLCTRSILKVQSCIAVFSKFDGMVIRVWHKC